MSLIISQLINLTSLSTDGLCESTTKLSQFLFEAGDFECVRDLTNLVSLFIVDGPQFVNESFKN